MKAYLPAFLLRFFQTVKMARELRRRAKEGGVMVGIPLNEEQFPEGCKLRNHCGDPNKIICPYVQE
jgi:hypothetical protein